MATLPTLETLSISHLSLAPPPYDMPGEAHAPDGCGEALSRGALLGRGRRFLQHMHQRRLGGSIHGSLSVVADLRGREGGERACRVLRFSSSHEQWVIGRYCAERWRGGSQMAVGSFLRIWLARHASPRCGWIRR